MTCIVGWLNIEKEKKDTIWVLGDTKISSPGGENTLTLEGSKVLSVPIRVKDLRVITPFQPAYYQNTLGFAFAGSSLVAYNSYNTICSLLANIGGGGELPTLEDISIKCGKVISFYTKTIGATCEVFITGMCPEKKEIQLFMAKPKLIKGVIEVEVYRLGFDHPQFYLLGNNKKEIEEIIAQKVEELAKNNENHCRAPFHALREIIAKQMFPSIGGYLQLGVVNPAPWGDFNQFSIYEQEGNGASKLYHNNIDVIEEIGTDLGKCHISMHSIHIP